VGAARRCAALVGALVLATSVSSTAAYAPRTPVVELTCGLTSFPSTALKNPLGAELREDPAAAALRAFLAQPFPPYPKHGWQLLLESESEALFGHPPYGRFGDEVRVVNNNGTWQFNQSAGCEWLSVVRPGAFVSGFYLDRNQPIRRSSRTLALRIGNDCRAEPLRLKSAELHWEPNRLVITVLMSPRPNPAPSVARPAVCIVPVTAPVYVIKLRRPLGHRQIYDGSYFPPIPVRDYPKA
jgi:hypothetical protein